MTDEKILIVDDECGMRNALREVLKRLGFTAETAEDGKEGLRLLSEKEYDLVLSDIRMPEMDGMTFLDNAIRDNPSRRIVMMTAYGTIEDAVEAMKRGAMDYLLKPFSADAVESVVKKCINTDKKAVVKPVSGIEKKVYFVAQSSCMKSILSLIRDVALSPVTILLEGESGTGKEVLSRMIHNLSGRGNESFVGVNCAAIPEGLLESELFGHEKGAFTGAVISRKGKFEQAHKGTILLDEITEMPLSLQVKLLRVIQEREIEPIGGKGPIPVDARIIAATNRNIEEEVQKGRFREDLFYRLNVIRINIPPLRERKEDLLPLASFFIQKYAKMYSRPAKYLSEEMKQFIEENPWYGNVRELENFIEKAVLLSKEEYITPCFINSGQMRYRIPVIEPVRVSVSGDEKVGNVLSESGKNCTLEEMEKNLISSTLQKVEWNKTKAAEILGVSVRTVRNKISYYNIEQAAKSRNESKIRVIENVG